MSLERSASGCWCALPIRISSSLSSCSSPARRVVNKLPAVALAHRHAQGHHRPPAGTLSLLGRYFLFSDQRTTHSVVYSIPCADTPEVTTALLKFMSEFVLNKTQVRGKCAFLDR